MIIFTAVVLYGLFTALILTAPDSIGESAAAVGGSGSGSGNQNF